MNEADTCRTYVLPKLKSAGWEDETITEWKISSPVDGSGAVLFKGKLDVINLQS